MRAPFYGESGSLELPRVIEFISRTSVQEVRNRLPGWDADPTDLLSVADIARGADKLDVALALYEAGLAAIEKDPSLLAPDTNLSGAYYFYGKLLLLARRPLDAQMALKRAAELSPQDATCWHLLGLSHEMTDGSGGAIDSYERALSLEGTQDNLDGAFFDDLRLRIAALKQESSDSRAIGKLLVNFEAARESANPEQVLRFARELLISHRARLNHETVFMLLLNLAISYHEIYKSHGSGLARDAFDGLRPVRDDAFLLASLYYLAYEKHWRDYGAEMPRRAEISHIVNDNRAPLGAKVGVVHASLTIPVKAARVEEAWQRLPEFERSYLGATYGSLRPESQPLSRSSLWQRLWGG